jgi:hypothetical protein
VNVAVISEQMLYEIGDPRRYLLPDVTCDFTQVRLEQVGADRVRVSGAMGLPAGPAYKVSATYVDGFRCTAQLTIVGFEAAAKARRTGEAVLQRTGEILQALDLAPFTRTSVEVLGSEEANYGPHAAGRATREVVLRIGAMHPQKQALEVLAREVAPAGTSWSPGTTGADGRPKVVPAIKQYSFLVDKALLAPCVVQHGERRPSLVPTGQAPIPEPGEPSGAETSAPHASTREVQLVRLAWARSGDKGDTSNVGVIARRPEWLRHLRSQLTPERVGAWLAHRVDGTVTRYDLPGIHAMNFVCTRALGGGGMASLRNDPLGKGMAQILLAMPVAVPQDWDVA